MIDEIDYFPKRDRYKKSKETGDDWTALKKLKESQSGNPATKKPPAGGKPKRPKPPPKP